MYYNNCFDDFDTQIQSDELDGAEYQEWLDSLPAFYDENERF